MKKTEFELIMKELQEIKKQVNEIWWNATKDERAIEEIEKMAKEDGYSMIDILNKYSERNKK